MTIGAFIPWLIAMASITGWLAASRWLYRRWVRNGALQVTDDECSHGYKQLHRGAACHGGSPIANGAVAATAMVAAVFFPVVFAAIFIMRDTPVTPQEREARLADLERENRELDAQIRRMS